MRKSLFIFILVLVCGAPVVPQDRCRSAAQVFGDLYRKWGEAAIAAGCVVGVTASTSGIGLAATLECIKRADKYAQAAEDMVKFFNAAADNGRWTIGPRRIEWGRPQTGAVVSTFSRVFVAAAPVDKDSITVKIKKLDGRAEADVIICRIDEKGNFVRLAQLEFDRGDGAGTEITRTVSGVKGHLVQVRIDADSVVRKFEYRLTVSK